MESRERVLSDLVAASHLVPGRDLAGLVFRTGRRMGLEGTRLYVTDLQQASLVALPQPESAEEQVLDIDGSAAGLSYRSQRPQWSRDGGTVWVPMIDGIERLGVLEATATDLDEDLIRWASVQGYQPSPHLLDYAMTKSAIISFTHGLAQMLADRGVRVNAVAPGPVWTPLIPATMPDPTKFGEQSPLGRPAQPGEMAPAFVFLASAQSSYITGEVVNATGGTPLP